MKLKYFPKKESFTLAGSVIAHPVCKWYLLEWAIFLLDPRILVESIEQNDKAFSKPRRSTTNWVSYQKPRTFEM